MARFFATIGTIAGVLLVAWVVINIFTPGFALSTGFIWTREWMAPVTNGIATVWNGFSRPAAAPPVVVNQPSTPTVPPGGTLIANRPTIAKSVPMPDGTTALYDNAGRPIGREFHDPAKCLWVRQWFVGDPWEPLYPVPCTKQGAAQPVKAAPAAPTATPQPAAPALAPAAQPAGGDSLPLGTFVSMWSADPNPAGLINQLNGKFDGGFAAAGGQDPARLRRIPAGSIVWTNTNGQPVKLSNGAVATPGDFVPLKTLGGVYGVFYTYQDVEELPNGGRYMQTDRLLSPCRDLPGWGVCP